MASIVTLTFSPCLDRSFETAALHPDQKLRCTNQRLEPGGGGINVARAIKKLGGEAVAIYPAGGAQGELLTTMLVDEQVIVWMVLSSTQTRENINVLEQSTGAQYRFIMPAPVLTERTWQSCLSALREADRNGYIVVSGSLPEGLPSDIFMRIRQKADQQHARLVVDVSGPALVQALAAGVYMIKPSRSELEQLAVSLPLDAAQPSAQIQEIVDKGLAEVVLYSDGSADVLLATHDLLQRIPVPRVDRQSTVGAGDSLVAGMVLSLSRGMPLPEAACYGIASAAASVMNPGTALCTKEDADRLYAGMRPNRSVSPPIASDQNQDHILT